MFANRLLKVDKLRRSSDVVSIGTVLQDRFVIIRLIGRTVLSAVYLGHDRSTNRAVAIKRLSTIPHDGLSQTALFHLFQWEARILRSLHHPQIPRLHAAFRERSGYYLVMDYIDGITLDQLLNRGKISLDVGLAIADGLCDVVAYLHRQAPPIIHADIKPGNVVLTQGGQVVLLDLGLARPRDSREYPAALAGTPGYAPPEQWRGEPLDERSDIYSLGMLLRELLGTTQIPAIQRALAHATAWNRHDRFATVAQLRRALHGSVEPKRQQCEACRVKKGVGLRSICSN